MHTVPVRRYQVRALRFHIRRRLRRFRRALLFVFVAALLGFLGVFLSLSPLGHDLDIWTMRQMYALRGPVDAPPEVFLVTVEDRTYRELGISPRQPPPRTIFARVLAELHSAAPRYVVIDATLAEDDFDRDGNEELRRAIAAGPTVLSEGFFEELPLRPGELPEITIPTDPEFIEVASYVLPMLFKQVRGVVSRLSVDGTTGGIPFLDLFEEPRRQELQSLLSGRELISFYGTHQVFPTVSYATIAAEGLTDHERERLRDSIIFFGFRSDVRFRNEPFKEQFLTPISRAALWGVEVHATVLSNLIEQGWLRRLSLKAEGRVVFGFLVLSTLALLRFPLVLALAAVVGAAGLGTALSVYLFIYEQLFIGGVALIWFLLFVALLVSTLMRYMIRESMHRKLQRELGIRLPA